MPSKKSLTRLPSEKRKRAFAFPAQADAQTMPPMFVTRELRRTIESMIPTRHHERMRAYFETYGCLHCGQKNVVYGATGFCMNCITKVRRRLRKVDSKLRASYPASTQDPDVREVYLRPYNSARELLADLAPKSRKPEPKKPYTIYMKS
jgi:hypothetical protein